jgi:ribonuclease D
MKNQVLLIDTDAEFLALMSEIKAADWFGYDTEFIGEKTFVPVLCLIQVLHKDNVYLIDPIAIKDLSAFLDLIVDERILKITHAGDNDYRLLYQLYKVVPKNLFDTQVAAGFIGYSYPTGFARIVGNELNLELAKGYAVTQWDRRPLDSKVLQYAVEDVLYLRELYDRMSATLRKHDRTAWVAEEISKWEDPAFYVHNPLRDFLSTDMVYKLRHERDKVFLHRLYEWRREKAEYDNIPKEHVLPIKYISAIVRSMKDGKRSLQNNRTIPDHHWQKYFNTWMKMYELDITDAERNLLASIPPEVMENAEKDWFLDLMYHLIKKRGVDTGVSAALLLSRTDFNRMKTGEFDHETLSGWRAELLGPELVFWLTKQGKISVKWEDHACILRMK